MGGLCAWPRGSSQAFGIEAPRICVRSSFLPPRHAPRGPRVTGERPPHEAEPFRRSPGWRAPARPSSGKATRRGPRVRFRVSWGPPLKRGKWRAARVPAHSTGWACGRGLPRSVLSPPAQRSPRHRPPFPQCPTPAVGAAAACPMPGPTRRCRGRAQGRGALAPPAGGREPPPEPAFCPWQRWLRPPQRCTGCGVQCPGPASSSLLPSTVSWASHALVAARGRAWGQECPAHRPCSEKGQGRPVQPWPRGGGQGPGSGDQVSGGGRSRSGARCCRRGRALPACGCAPQAPPLLWPRGLRPRRRTSLGLQRAVLVQGGLSGSSPRPVPWSHVRGSQGARARDTLALPAKPAAEGAGAQDTLPWERRTAPTGGGAGPGTAGVGAVHPRHGPPRV